MTRIIAIASLQIRAAVRSKLFISLTAVLVLILFGLPATIKGDGTLLGQMKVLLYYTLGLTTLVLGAATLWTSSGAISQEIESRQIHLIAVKPVHPFEIWLGKWLGLLLMNAALLCFTGLIIMGLIHLNINAAGRSDQERRIVSGELLAGRILIRPHDTLQQEAGDRYHNLLKKGAIPADVPHEEALSDIRKQLLTEKTVVPPLSSRRWVLEIPGNLNIPEEGSTTGMALKLRFSPVRSGTNSVSGRWNIGTERRSTISSMVTSNRLDGMHQVTIPVTRALMAEIMAEPGRKMIVEFRNDSNERSRTLVFDRTSGIELFIRESGFESNLVRALLIVLCRLALLTALGLAASTLFSSPVAAFASFSILLVSFLTHFFILMSGSGFQSCCAEHAEKNSKGGVFQMASTQSIKKLETVFGPVMQIEAVGPLSDGAYVSWKDVGKAVLVMAVLYPGLLGAAGVLLFRRRELALPYT